jgi:hypothetical protein
MGFVIQRRYEGLDNPEDVYQDTDGVWYIKKIQPAKSDEMYSPEVFGSSGSDQVIVK